MRRPSSTFSALDPAAGRGPSAPGGQPRVGSPAAAPSPAAGPLGAGAVPRAPAPATTSGPVSTTARTAERPVPAGLPTLESSGALGRPRSATGMSAQRPAPAPHALFEKPTADDIDRALAVLTEVDAPAPAAARPPADFSSRLRHTTDAQPTIVESAADVGDAPKASPPRPPDAQPLVVESMPEVGNPPARRTGTRPLFSSPEAEAPDLRRETVPMIPVGDAAAAQRPDDVAAEAWVDSGPTRVGGLGLEAAMAAAPAGAALEGAAPSPSSTTTFDEPPRAAPTLPVSSGPAVPALVTPKSGGTKPKKRSSAPLFFMVLLLAGAAGGAFLYFTDRWKPGAGASGTTTAANNVGPGEVTSAPAAGAATPTQANPATADAASAAGGGEPAKAAAAPNTPTGEIKAAEPKAAEAKPAEGKIAEGKIADAKPGDTRLTGSGATIASLRARPIAEPENAATPEPIKEAETKPATHSSHRSRHHTTAEATPAVADAAPSAAGDAPRSAGGDSAPSKGSSALKITTSPTGAEVIIDGNAVGRTPYLGADVDPGLPHSIMLKKDGFEDREHMVSSSDWPHAHNGVRTLRLNVKLRAAGGGEAATVKPEDAPAPPSEQTPGLGTTPASPKRE